MFIEAPLNHISSQQYGESKSFLGYRAMIIHLTFIQTQFFSKYMFKLIKPAKFISQILFQLYIVRIENKERFPNKLFIYGALFRFRLSQCL